MRTSCGLANSSTTPRSIARSSVPWRATPSWEIVEKAEAALGRPLAALLLEVPDEALTRTLEAQLTVFLQSLMAWEAVRAALEQPPIAFAGHSLGQLTAVAHAGVEDAREMSEVTATDEKLRPLAEATGGGVFWTRGGGLLSSIGAGVDVPRISMLSNAKVLAGTGWMGLKDREAYVTRGVKLTPMFTGLTALSALLLLIGLAWWREGR